MPISEYQARVQHAVATMEAGDAAIYLQKTIEQRAGKSGHTYGSVYPDMDAAAVREAVMNADWQPFAHEAVMKGCTAFTAPLPGVLGMTFLATLPDSAEVLLMDIKGTGFFSVISRQGERAPADHTVIILGNDKDQEVIFTFHPGDPVSPSTIPSHGQRAKLVTVADARALGFGMAKIAGEDEWRAGLALTAPPASPTTDAPKLLP